MRFSLGLPAFAVLAAALPAPQDIDIDMVLAAPDPTYSEAVGVTAQVVTYDYTSIAAQATSAVSSVSIAISDVLSSTAVVKRNAKRTACASQPTGVSGYSYSPDSATAFKSNSAFASAASSAPIPSGYTNTFVNLNASNNAYGYLGFTTLSTYNTTTCASKCTAINGCMSFNLYFERDPSVEPGTGCDNPASVTLIKCVFWGGPVSSSNANNYGQTWSNFSVVIAGSNGYTNNTLIIPSGYGSAAYLGNVAINAPYDAQGYNTYMGSTIFNAGPFNASLCSTFCDAQTKYNLATAPTDGTPAKVCRFFNTYLLYLNTTAHMQGQYCALYTEAWSSTYATNAGQYSGNDHYMVEYSYTFTNSTSAGYAPTSGDKAGAIYQARQDMTYYSSQLTTTYQPFCSSLLGYSVPTTTTTTTSTPISTVVVSQTTTVTAIDALIKRTLSTPNVLTKYPATVISSACSLLVTKPASTLTSTTVQTVTGAAVTSYSTTVVSTQTVFS